MNDAYINFDNFVTVEPRAETCPGEGNGWLQTGLAVATGIYRPTQSMIVDMFIRCAYGPNDPRIWRSPWKKNPGDEEQADDYWGALVMSQPWAIMLSIWIDDHGTNFDPTPAKRLKYWFGRFPMFRPMVRVCAGGSKWYHHALLALGILWDSLFIGSASGNMIAFCRISKARQVSSLCAWASKLWVWRIKKHYGAVGMSWEEYFHSDHPLVGYDE